MWIHFVFGLFLLAIAVLMSLRNAAAWRSDQANETEDRERDYLYRRYRRRGQANVMVGIVGVAIIVGVWVTDPYVAGAYWLGVVLIVGWMALLAVADLIAARVHYGRLHQDQLDERATLEAELDQIKRRGSNGRPQKPKKDSE